MNGLQIQFLMLIFAGWVNRSQLEVIAYLKEENRVLREQLGNKRLFLTDAQRRRLAAKAKLVGRRGLFEIETLVTPDTLLRWYRTLIAKKYDGSAVRRPGRPKTADEIENLIVRMARDNPGWGYTRIRGALYNLGHDIGRNTIKRILFDNGIDPAPLRDKAMSWKTFLSACGWRIGKSYGESNLSCSLVKIGEGDNVAPMRDLLILTIHLLVTCTKLLRPGGVRAVAAESLILKHQILISNRSRRRAPNLTTLDRFVLGLTTLFIRPHRISKLSALLATGTLLKFHKALVDRKYRLLFSSAGNRGKAWSKGAVSRIDRCDCCAEVPQPQVRLCTHCPGDRRCIRY